MARDNRSRMMVIGIDGGTLDVIHPLIEQGRLPHLAQLMKGGAWGKLGSTIPPLSPPAWASFLTGRNPGKHGVFHFLTQPRNGFETEICNSGSIHGPKLWDFLGRRGKRVGFMDVPLTYPPVEVNGFMISGIPVPSEEAIFTFPPSLHTAILAELGDFPLEDRITQRFFSGEGYLAALRELYFFTRTRKEIVPFLQSRFDCDFLMVVFRGTDHIQHRAWQFFDADWNRSHPQEAKKFGQVIPQYYEEIDRSIGALVGALGEEWTVLVMSDHGAGPLKKQFLINLWLIQKGYLRLKPGLRLRAKKLKRERYVLGGLFQKAGLPFLARLVPASWRAKELMIPRLRSDEPWNLVDWSRTKAYSNWFSTESMIRINLKGREPEGIIQPGEEYERLRDELISQISQVRDPDTGEQIVERVHRREEVYSGPFLSDAPDLQIVTRGWAYPFYGDLVGPSLFRTPEDLSPSVHLYHGLFILKGSSVRQDLEVEGADILDLTPTILYLMGVPIPRDLDGALVEQALKEDVLRSRPPEYVETSEEVLRSETQGGVFSPAEKEKIELTLRGLGYLG